MRRFHKVLFVCSIITINVLHEVQSVRDRRKEEFDASDLTKITYGTLTTIEKYPFIVSIQKWNQHTCGGSLILRDWVLTAGHCMLHGTTGRAEFEDLSLTMVVAGLNLVNVYQEITAIETESSWLDPAAENVRNVTNLYLYRYYKAQGDLTDDIGLFKLASKFELSNTIKLIRLPTSPYMLQVLKDNTECVVIGWGNSWDTRRRRRSRDPHGKTSHMTRHVGNASLMQFGVASDVDLANAKDEHLNRTEDILQARFRHKRHQGVVNRPLKEKITYILDPPVCFRLYPPFLSARQLCTDFEGRGASCQGDSGGPMICGGYPGGAVFGLVSGGLGPPKVKCKGTGNEKIHIYTRIDFYLDWIYKTIGPDEWQ